MVVGKYYIGKKFITMFQQEFYIVYIPHFITIRIKHAILRNRFKLLKPNKYVKGMYILQIQNGAKCFQPQ